jgi:peptide/nickel transport system permease protein
VAGASDNRIIFRHVLPNAVGVIIVNSTLLMAAAILIETGLSFLGYGVQSPDTSLGKIISENQSAFATRPWLFWWPGVFIISIALCVNFIGDGLRDAFDPRQKRMPSERALRTARKGGTPKDLQSIEAQDNLDRAATEVTGRGAGMQGNMGRGYYAPPPTDEDRAPKKDGDR